ncbi:MAG: trypsin-like peptidase domain-containing protein, partial [Parcubacteria group bacterium]|nr:trypsin-like peptidase domain-containing protein [Parcubacteria group bacterium]
MGRMTFSRAVLSVTLPAALIGALVGGLVGSGVAWQVFTRRTPSLPESGTRFLETVTSEEEAVITLVEQTSPAVVSIIITKNLPVLERFFGNPFEGLPFPFEIPEFQERGQREQRIGGGSGFIVSSDGLVVTNRHVVAETDADYTVVLASGKQYKATVLARDPVQDIAVLKINITRLPTVRLGNSDTVKTGQKVVAIGYALGEFQNTVSLGVVSGLSRSIVASSGQSSETLEGLIQTDASINPGNS